MRQLNPAMRVIRLCNTIIVALLEVFLISVITTAQYPIASLNLLIERFFWPGLDVIFAIAAFAWSFKKMKKHDGIVHKWLVKKEKKMLIKLRRKDAEHAHEEDIADIKVNFDEVIKNWDEFRNLMRKLFNINKDEDMQKLNELLETAMPGSTEAMHLTGQFVSAAINVLLICLIIN